VNAFALPAARARLANAELPAAGAADTLLHVECAGRFSIRANSAAGTALQSVDTASGPGEWTGVPAPTMAGWTCFSMPEPTSCAPPAPMP
jgi:hypothetical protein